jgi:hypothetical protein
VQAIERPHDHVQKGATLKIQDITKTIREVLKAGGTDAPAVAIKLLGDIDYLAEHPTYDHVMDEVNAPVFVRVLTNRFHFMILRKELKFSVSDNNSKRIMVNVDATVLENLLIRVITDAIESQPQHGVVDIRLVEKATTLEVSVLAPGQIINGPPACPVSSGIIARTMTMPYGNIIQLTLQKS